MARLITCGFEQQQLSATVGACEGEGFAATGGGTLPTIETTVVRSGAAALKCVDKGFGYWDWNGGLASNDRWYRFRTYYRISGSPSAQTTVIVIEGASSYHLLELRLNTDRTLRLYRSNGATAVGSASAAIAANTWVMIEVGINVPASGTSGQYELRVDGVTVTSGTADLTNGAPRYWVVGDYIFANPGISMYFDDVALNDDQGSAQNSWPGAGAIYLQKGKGTNSYSWALSHAGDANFWQSTSNVPPIGTAPPAAANTQIQSNNANTTDEAGPVLQTPAEAGMPTGTTIALTQAIAQIGSGDTTSRSAKLVRYNGSIYTDDGSGSTPAAAVGTSPSNWKTIRGAVAYAPSYPGRTQDAYVKLIRQTSGGMIYTDFIGALIEVAPDQTGTLGIGTETDTGLGLSTGTGALSAAASDVLGRIGFTFTQEAGYPAPDDLKVYRSADGSTFAEITRRPAAWQPSTAYVPGDVVRPVTANGKCYRMAGYVSGTSGGSEPTWVGSGQASDGVLRWEEFTPVKLVDNGDGTWTVTDLRPQNGSQAVALPGTAYYKVRAVRGGVDSPALTNAVSAVSAVDKSARDLGTWAAIHSVMATQATRENSSHLSYAYPHRYLMSAAYVAATYPAKRTEALTDLDTWWTFVKTQLTAEGLFVATGYPTYCYIGHTGEMLPYLVAIARLLRNALGTDTTTLPSGLVGAPALAADIIAKADAMGVGMIDYLERYTVTSGNLGTDDPLPGDASAWAGGTSYQPGAIVRPTSANGRVYRMIANGAKTSGGTEPTWPTTAAAMTTTVDGGCWWQECTSEFPAWQATTAYRLGQVVRPIGLPVNITRTGTINAGTTTINGLATTADLAVGDKVYNAAGALFGTVTTITNSTTVQVDSTFVAGASLSLTFRRPARSYRCIVAGTSGGSQPTWPASGEVADGSARWEETTVSGDIFANVYTPTSPYNAINAAGTGVSDELARVIAGFAGLLNDPDATHFKTGGSKRATAFTIVVDHCKVLATHFAGTGANIDDPTWQAQDTLYMSYTMHLLAVGLHEWEQVYTPATANHRTLGAIVSRAKDWLSAQYSTEPTLGNDGHPAAIATPYTGRAELAWRKVPFAVAGVADPLGDLIYSAGMLPYQYLPAGSAYTLSSYDVDDLNFLSALGLPAAYGTPQVAAAGVAGETDTGLPITTPLTGAVDFGTETDTGLAVTPQAGPGPQTGTVDVAVETDAGLGVLAASPQTGVIGVGTETDSAGAIVVPGVFVMNMQLPPGTVVGAYRRHEWIGSEIPVRGAGSYPGPVVQESTVDAEGRLTFLLGAGSYIAWTADFPTRRRFFVVTD